MTDTTQWMRHVALGVLAALVIAPVPSAAQQGANKRAEILNIADEEELIRPLSLREILEFEGTTDVIDLEEAGLPLDIRLEAIREAALSYGARAGLARRSYEIRRELERRSRYMDKVYDFRQLLIPAPSGLLIEPPIVNQSLNAMLIDDGGLQAAVSDRIYNIINNARITSTARSWRTYLERTWGDVEPPPPILRPMNDEEALVWEDLIYKGWEQGVAQANEIFEADLARLNGDFEGMVRYRMLLAQGMISAPYALQVDRGVTGTGTEMRVGDRAVQITGVPQLITGSETWKPANR